MLPFPGSACTPSACISIGCKRVSVTTVSSIGLAAGTVCLPLSHLFRQELLTDLDLETSQRVVSRTTVPVPYLHSKDGSGSTDVRISGGHRKMVRNCVEQHRLMIRESFLYATSACSSFCRRFLPCTTKHLPPYWQRELLVPSGVKSVSYDPRLFPNSQVLGPLLPARNVPGQARRNGRVRPLNGRRSGSEKEGQLHLTTSQRQWHSAGQSSRRKSCVSGSDRYNRLGDSCGARNTVEGTDIVLWGGHTCVT